jgi:predicted amidophosphoribosyltransferase
MLMRVCAGCHDGEGPLCRRCAALVRGPARRAFGSPSPAGLPDVWAVADYDGPVREAIVAFKDHGRWSLRGVLGRALAVSLAGAIGGYAGPLLLVPLPGSPGSVRDRDGDHVRELATVAARHVRRTGAEVRVVMGLVGIRSRLDQVGLDRRQRAANMAGSMRATRAVVERSGVVLVDDVVTSGASIAEASRALRAAGCEPLAASVVAATRRSH